MTSEPDQMFYTTSYDASTGGSGDTLAMLMSSVNLLTMPKGNLNCQNKEMFHLVFYS